ASPAPESAESSEPSSSADPPRSSPESKWSRSCSPRRPPNERSHHAPARVAAAVDRAVHRRPTAGPGDGRRSGSRCRRPRRIPDRHQRHHRSRVEAEPHSAPDRVDLLLRPLAVRLALLRGLPEGAQDGAAGRPVRAGTAAGAELMTTTEPNPTTETVRDPAWVRTRIEQALTGSADVA